MTIGVSVVGQGTLESGFNFWREFKEELLRQTCTTCIRNFFVWMKMCDL
jgi:hypothetical protein